MIIPLSPPGHVFAFSVLNRSDISRDGAEMLNQANAAEVLAVTHT